jgi:serine/threonine-protein kinase
MVMEYVNGKTLEEWVQTHGPMQPAIACSLVVQILDGLQHAHRKGIIHRDLKPANVMISEEGEVKVMDFGIARIRNSQRITQHGKSVGTLEYMAPEQIQGKEGDERTDIYAAGNILYELLCGQPPFRADTDYSLMKAKLEETPPLLPALVSVQPPALRQIILKALARNPEKRFDSVTAFRDALDNCMQHSFLREYSLVQALHHPVSQDVIFQQTQKNETTWKWKSNAASLSSGFLTNLSYHSRQVSDQFAKLISSTFTSKQKRSHTPGIAGFFSRVQQLINDNSFGFLVFIILICGILILWSYFSTEPVDYTVDKVATSAVNDSGKVEEKEADPANAYIIEAQLSKVPPLTPGGAEVVEDKDDTKTKLPPKNKTVKKKEEPPKDKTGSAEEGDGDSQQSEAPPEEEPVSPKREPTGPVNIPAGKPISLVLDETLSSEEPGRDGDAIRLRCYEDIKVEGRTVVKKGAYATGKIVDVVPSNKRKRAVIGFVIQKIEASDGSTLKIDSERFKLVAGSPGVPAVYRTGQVFFAKLGRGRLN